MQMHFTMVPMPMTAAEKFNEAVYFFNQMVVTVNNTRTFPFNLSAFLSALRSTTFYLQVQYGHDPKFADWYSRAQESMKSDPVLKLLKELRTEVVHQRPVNLLVKSGPQFHENPIVTDHLEIMHSSDSAGNIVWRYRVGRDGEERSAEPITDWDFDTYGGSVLTACRQGLAHIEGLLREWQELFGTKDAAESGPAKKLE
jgi:hypothetical protein